MRDSSTNRASTPRESSVTREWRSDLEAPALGTLGPRHSTELGVGETFGVAERLVERLVDEWPLVVRAARVFGDAARFSAMSSVQPSHQASGAVRRVRAQAVAGDAVETSGAGSGASSRRRATSPMSTSGERATHWRVRLECGPPEDALELGLDLPVLRNSACSAGLSYGAKDAAGTSWTRLACPTAPSILGLADIDEWLASAEAHHGVISVGRKS